MDGSACLASIKQPEQQADSLCTASLPITEISHHAEQWLAWTTLRIRDLCGPRGDTQLNKTISEVFADAEGQGPQLLESLSEHSNCHKLQGFPESVYDHHCCHGPTGRCYILPLRSPVPHLARIGTSPNGHCWSSSSAGIEQGRRRLSEKIADARCSLDHQQGLVSGFHQGQQALGPHKQDG